MTDERVLVVPRAAVLPGSGWHGVQAADLAAVSATIAREGRFEPRPAMEREPGFKQIIPYVVLRDGGRYFLLRRTRAGADERLHDRFSIGIGGHLNPGDGDLDGGLRREWAEELEAGFVPDFRFVGLLNDDSTEVGSVHLGVVFTADALGRAVRVRETDKLTGGWAAPTGVAAVVDRMETWSAIVFDFLERRATSGSPGAPARASGAAVR